MRTIRSTGGIVVAVLSLVACGSTADPGETVSVAGPASPQESAVESPDDTTTAPPITVLVEEPTSADPPAELSYEAQLAVLESNLYVTLTHLVLPGYERPVDVPLPEGDLLVLYVNGKVAAKASLPTTAESVWGVRLGVPETERLTFRLEFESPDGERIASAGEFTFDLTAEQLEQLGRTTP